jgi:hypothetical protein
MSREIIEVTHHDNYHYIQHLMFIFSQIFIPIFKGVLND